MTKQAHRIAGSIALLCCAYLLGIGQTPSRETAGTVSGRVTMAGKGVADVTVIATTTTPYDTRTVGKSTTDEEGNYRLTNVPPGRLNVTPVAKAYVIWSSGISTNQNVRSINVFAGEEITKIDFTLGRAGVITGRITDSSGHPLIGELVTVLPTDSQAPKFSPSVFDGLRNRTDDRGIYRIYGLPPGTYKVSVGQAAPHGATTLLNSNGSQYLKTFYPDAADEAKADVLEVKEGSEIKDIDITTRKGSRGFAVSGRVTDAVTGKPVPNVYVGYSPIDDSEDNMGRMNFARTPTDTNGAFRLEGLQPGEYGAFTFGVGTDNTSYSEPAKFDVTDGDVSGVEVKVSPGATIEGVAIVENNADPAVTAIIGSVNLYAFVEKKGSAGPSFARSKVNSDGSFKFTGLSPGKVRIVLQQYPISPKGISLLRTELNGVVQEGGVDVAAGAKVHGVRLVFAYGDGSVRGTVKVEGGTLPEGTVMWLMIGTSEQSARGFQKYLEVDSRGQFTAENIPPGTYELTLHASVAQKELPGFPAVKRTVIITNGVETQVTIVVDLTAKKDGSN